MRRYLGRGEGEEGGNVGEEVGEEKIKSAYGKNEFCDHSSLFLQNQSFLPADFNFSCGGRKNE